MSAPDTDPRRGLVALAHWYAADLGVPTFPCNARGAPLTPNGFKDATTDLEAIDTWADIPGFALLGRPTGDGLLVVDLDIKGGKNGIQEWEMLCEAYGEPGHTLVAQTKSLGQHCYFRLPEGVECKSMSGQLMLPSGRKAAGVDTRSTGGYVIAPGSPGYSWNDCDSIEDVVDGLANLAEAPEWLIGMLRHGLVDVSLPDDVPRQRSTRVKHLVSDIVRGNNLHDSTRDLVAKLASDTSKDAWVLEVVESLMEVSRAKETRLVDWKERYRDLPRLLAGAREKFGFPDEDEEIPEEHEGLFSRRIDMRRLATEDPPEIEWLVQDRIQRGRGLILTGLGGSSKTRFAYHLAVGLAIGRLPWDWHIGQTGKTMLVMTEDTLEDVHRALGYMLRGLSQEDIEKVVERVIPYPLAGNGIKLLQRVGGVLEPTLLAEQLEAEILTEGDVALVVVDPALGVTEGDENDQSHARELGQWADNASVRTGATHMLLTHAAKGMANAEEINSHSSRGAGALTDAVRSEFVLRTMTDQEAIKAGIQDKEEQKRHVQLLATKGNHIPPAAFVPLWLRRGEHGVLGQAEVDLTAGGVSEAVAGRDAQALAILADMCKTDVPTKGQWAERMTELGVVPAKSAAKITQGIARRLVSAGRIQPGMGKNTVMPTPDVKIQ